MQSQPSPRGSTRSLVAFFVLAFALAWWTWPLTLLNPDSVPMLPWSPVMAAVIVAAVVGGRRELRALLASTTRWRVGVRWYAVALLLPAAITALAVLGHVLLGADAPTRADLGDWYLLPVSFVLTLVVKGPLTEEIGWRGFALLRLLARMSPLAASVLLGVVWAVWHLPLMVSGPSTGQRPPLQFGLSVVAMSILFTWLYQQTGRSVLLVALMHAALNTIAGFLFPTFDGALFERLWWIYVAVLWAAALGVLVAGRGLVPSGDGRARWATPRPSSSA